MAKTKAKKVSKTKLKTPIVAASKAVAPKVLDAKMVGAKVVNKKHTAIWSLPKGSLLEVTQLVNDGTITAKVKRAVLRDKYGCSAATAQELCPDSIANY